MFAHARIRRVAPSDAAKSSDREPQALPRTNERPAGAAMTALHELASSSARAHDAAQLQRLADRHGTAMQQKAAASGGMTGQPLPAPGPARSLPRELRSTMEGALGMDFSHVRLHEGARATAMGALAYTQGTDIHFASGLYQPQTRAGRELIGHELAHVVQQAQGRVRPTGHVQGVPTNDDVALEREADRRGHAAARGEAPDLGSSRAAPAPAPAGHVSQAMPVQRLIVPTLAPTVGPGHPHRLTAAAARQAYDDALNYLWASPTARHIYNTLHAHATTVEIRVGAPQSFTSHDGNVRGPAGCLVEWDPFEVPVLIDTDNRTMAINNGTAPIQPQNVIGTVSTATLLFHELGHAKQHIELEDFDAAIAPNFWANMGRGNPAVGNMVAWLTTIHASIDQLYRPGAAGVDHPQRTEKILSTIRPVGARNNLNVHRDIVEPDNVTRHERPIAMEQSEQARRNYFATLPLHNLPALPRAMVAPPPAEPMWHVTHSMKFGRRLAEPVDTSIVTHLQRLLGILTQDAGLLKQGAMSQARLVSLRNYLRHAVAFFRDAQTEQRTQIGTFGPLRALPTFANP